MVFPAEDCDFSKFQEKIDKSSSFNRQGLLADYSTFFSGIDVSHIFAFENYISDWFLVGPYTWFSEGILDYTLEKGQDLLSNHDNPDSRVQTVQITLQSEDTLGKFAHDTLGSKPDGEYF